MIFPIGSLVYVRVVTHEQDKMCVVISGGRPEFIGKSGGNQYYAVYCFKTKRSFYAFDYEMVVVGRSKSLISKFDRQNTPKDL